MTESAVTLKENRNGVRRYATTESVEEGDTVRVVSRIEHEFDDDEVNEYVGTVTRCDPRPSVENLKVVFTMELDDNSRVSIVAIGRVIRTEEGRKQGDWVGEVDETEILS